MTLVDRYILRLVIGAFLLVLGVLTAIVWLTSTLQKLDLLVSQGAAFTIFLGVTLLALPSLIALIAPFSLFIALLFVLNKLNTDSELIVMSAAGMSQGRLVRPLLLIAATVAAISLLMSLFIVPSSLRAVREAITNARADLITQVIQPGKFTTVDVGLTFHVRERGSNGLLYGVFVSDTRDAEIEMTYLALRGVITKRDSGTFMVLEEGQIVRKPKKGSGYPSVISFESYPFNLSAFVDTAPVTFLSAQERSTAELFNLMKNPPEDQRFAGRVRGEINDRFAAPLYPLAFVFVAFAALGRAKTTRQSRTESVGLAILVIVLIRITGFVASGLAQRTALAVPLIYAVPFLGLAASAYMSLGSGPRKGGMLLKSFESMRMPVWLRLSPR